VQPQPALVTQVARDSPVHQPIVTAPAPPPIIYNPQVSQPVKEIHPDKYDIGQDWEVYITSFHEIATYNNWDTYTAAARLKFSLSQKALEMAHNVAQLAPNCTFGQLVNDLSPIFGAVYKEGKAATLFDQRCRKSSESYHDYMLELFKLFNQAYPHENPLSRSQRISKRFILGIGDENLAQYLADQTYSGPMELVKLAERRQCLFMELQSANRANAKVADADEPDVFPNIPETTPKKAADIDKKSRLHPDDLKAIGESVSQSLGTKLTQRRPHGNNYNRGPFGCKWPPLQPQDWPYRPRNKEINDNNNKVVKVENQLDPAPATAQQAGNGMGLATNPTTVQSKH